jgi:chromosome segregation ATPase
VKDLRTLFAEAERRVRGMADENVLLRGRVRGLEQELTDVRRRLQELERFQGAREDLRGRLERIRSLLETITGDDRPQEEQQAGEASSKQ